MAVLVKTRRLSNPSYRKIRTGAMKGKRSYAQLLHKSSTSQARRMARSIRLRIQEIESSSKSFILELLGKGHG